MYEAQGLSRVFQVDPQMQLPLRPRLSEDYLVVPLGEAAMMISGGEKPELFRGKSAAVLLPHLIPLLDGHRTFADLESALPHVKPAVIRDAVSLLFFRGLIEEGETESDRASFSDEERSRYAEQLRFFGRFTDVNRISANRYGAQKRLKDARVLVLADGAFAADVVSGMAQSGVGAVTIVTRSEEERHAFRALIGINPFCEVTLVDGDVDFDALIAEQTIVIALATVDPVSRWEDLDRRCRRVGTSWMRCIANSEGSEVGPIFTGQENACYRCYIDWHALTAETSPENESVPLAVTSFIELAIGFELSKVFLPNLMDRTRRLDVATGAVSEQRVLRLPRCSTCGLGREEGEPELVLPDDLAAAYHLSTNHKWSGMNKKAHQVHYSEHVSKLNEGAFKIYRTLPRIALPAIEEASLLDLDIGQALSGESAPARPLALESVAQICGWTARWRDPQGAPRRFVPSGGGLCSSDLYVVVWDVEGLPAGIYHYEGRGHQLEILRPGDVRQELRSMVAAPQLIDDAKMLLVQTLQIARFHSKYGPRAYRYGHLDAGVMTMSLQLLARAAGVRLRNTAMFADDCVGALLGLSPHQELPTQLLFAGDRQAGGQR